MSQVRTTLAAACNPTDTKITVASATSIAAGGTLLVNNASEVMVVQKGYTTGTVIPVLRGQDGTVTGGTSQGTFPNIHPSGASVVVYALPTDLVSPAPGTVVSFPPAARALIRTSVSTTAGGALTFTTPGADYDVQLNGTTIIAATLVNPSVDMDGTKVTISGNGKAAHTVTYTTTGFGNVGATSDIVTFSATQAQSFIFEAAGGFWNLIALGTATASVTGPTVG